MGDDAPTTAVEPATLEHVEALLAGGAAFEERFGLRVAPGYLDEFAEALEPIRRALADGVPPAWFAHLVVDPEAKVLVGFGGYTGPPHEGEVEIGYSVAPAHRGRGHATAAAQELVRRARAAGCSLASAHTRAEPNASTRVLERCGLARVGEVEDPDEGLVWRWELRLG